MQPFVHKFTKKRFPEYENLIKIAQAKFDQTNENIPPSSMFTKKELIESKPEFGWMSKVRMRIVVKTGTILPDYVPVDDIIEVDSLDTLMDIIEKEAQTSPYAKKKIVALDLETTGLSPNWRLYNSEYEIDVKIVGIPLATSSTEGYYIPIMHTEEDEVPNFPYEDAIEFLTKLVNKYHIIYHNAQYDMNVLMNNGVIVDDTNFADTMLLNKIMNNWEYFEQWVRNGLKKLSEYVLKRKMLEIAEILGVQKNGIILFNRLPAVNAYIYACVVGSTQIKIRYDGDKKVEHINIKDAQSYLDSYPDLQVHSPDGYVDLVTLFDNGRQRTVTVNFEKGKSLVCTADHLIETTNRGWIEAGNLKSGDDVVTESD